MVPRILDDMEMYEQQNPFKLQDFINMSQFLNMFVYKSIMGQLFGEHNYNHFIFIFLTIRFLSKNYFSFNWLYVFLL